MAFLSYVASADDANEISFEQNELLDIADIQGCWRRAKKADGTEGIVPWYFFFRDYYPYKAKALCDYAASADSSNKLSFKTYEIFDVAEIEMERWQAKKSDGTTGIVPSIHFQII
ncbi:hypothetical protein PILCRDRAFT_820615 [Piloderma croceum F 1598]|uniref:SH3 domain-containing protein n=1 Tax=Piloderma croceum (strain F 1598) TaxID=765440 RepID=A0A0C3BY00_PILCF|nr:hypothetical protein PILCRDRAFT_820615 [Piloderma croceum F 1598]